VKKSLVSACLVMVLLGTTPAAAGVSARVVEPQPGLSIRQWSGQVRVVVQVDGLPPDSRPWVNAHILRPDGTVYPLPLRDNGAAEFGDVKAADGLHSGYYRGCDKPGKYRITTVWIEYQQKKTQSPVSREWEVTPAHPLDITDAITRSTRPREVEVQVKIASRYWGQQPCEVKTASGAGESSPKTVTLDPNSDANVRITYSPSAIASLTRSKRFVVKGFLKRRGELRDEIVVEARPLGAEVEPQRVTRSFTASVTLPWLQKWYGTLLVFAIIGALIILIGLRQWCVTRPQLEWKVEVFTLPQDVQDSASGDWSVYCTEANRTRSWDPALEAPCRRLVIGSTGDACAHVAVNELGQNQQIILTPLRAGPVRVSAKGELDIREAYQVEGQKNLTVRDTSCLRVGPIVLRLTCPAP
jgi:hypothetical protein